MSKIVKKKIVNNAAIVVEDVAVMELDQGRLSALKRVMDDDSNATLKLVDGVWVYEVERVIPLNAQEWERLAQDVQATNKEPAVEDIAAPVPDVKESTSEATPSISVELPEYTAIEAFKDLFL